MLSRAPYRAALTSAIRLLSSKPSLKKIASPTIQKDTQKQNPSDIEIVKQSELLAPIHRLPASTTKCNAHISPIDRSSYDVTNSTSIVDATYVETTIQFAVDGGNVFAALLRRVDSDIAEIKRSHQEIRSSIHEIKRSHCEIRRSHHDIRSSIHELKLYGTKQNALIATDVLSVYLKQYVLSMQMIKLTPTPLSRIKTTLRIKSVSRMKSLSRMKISARKKSLRIKTLLLRKPWIQLVSLKLRKEINLVFTKRGLPKRSKYFEDGDFCAQLAVQPVHLDWLAFLKARGISTESYMEFRKYRHMRNDSHRFSTTCAVIHVLKALQKDVAILNNDRFAVAVDQMLTGLYHE
jgi:hypothetical protein